MKKIAILFVSLAFAAPAFACPHDEAKEAAPKTADKAKTEDKAKTPAKTTDKAKTAKPAEKTTAPKGDKVSQK